VRKKKEPEPVVELGRTSRVAVAIVQHPREFVGIVMATVATFSIFINALFLQKGPHPAPIFATRPLLRQATPIAPPRPQSAPQSVTANAEPVPGPVATPAPAADTAQSRTQLISNIQRELNRRGFYDGAVDGVWGAKTDSAARDFAQAAGMRINVEASDALLHAILSSGAKRAAEPARNNDPIAQLIAPSKRVLGIQRALADFGYGQLKPSGVYDPQTRSAIEKFEHDHRLPVTGQISDTVVRELEAMTGRPLD
jgi:peptidoglycan hydrolase-like protein with peptidoglycan-binding domain